MKTKPNLATPTMAGLPPPVVVRAADAEVVEAGAGAAPAAVAGVAHEGVALAGGGVVVESSIP